MYNRYVCSHNQRAWDMFTYNRPGCKLELPNIVYISLYYKIITTVTVFILLVHLSFLAHLSFWRITPFGALNRKYSKSISPPP